MCNFNQTKISLISHELVYLSVFLVPFQFLRFPPSLYNATQLDLSTFFLMISLVLSSFCNKVKKSFMASLLIFAIIEILVFFYFSYQSILRFSFFLVVYSFFLGFYFLADNYKLDEKKLFNITLLGLIISGVVVLFQAFDYGLSIRQKALMNEPTFSGLLFYSATFASYAVFCYIKLQKKLIILLHSILFFICGNLTQSMFLVPFLVIMTFFNLYLLFKIHLTKPVLLKNFLFLLVLIFFLKYFGNLSNILERLNLLNSYNNLSLLTYLSCIDEASGSIVLSPFFGLSAGSSGAFPYFSFYESLIFIKSSFNSNSNDAYSLLLRLISELGPLATSILLIFIIFRFFYFFKSKIGDYSFKRIFLFIYVSTVFLFCLIKGSSLTHGYLFVFLFIFIYLSRPLKINL